MLFVGLRMVVVNLAGIGVAMAVQLCAQTRNKDTLSKMVAVKSGTT